MALTQLIRGLAVTALLAGCVTPQVPGNYEAMLSEGRDVERRVRVTLAPGGHAAVSTARWGSFSYFAEGGWKRGGDRMIVVELSTVPPQRLAFQLGGDQLVAKEWDHSVWGDRGPGVLYRVH